MKKALLILLMSCMIVSGSVAQDSLSTKPSVDDTLRAEAEDTVQLKSYATRYDPRKAILYAAIVPGLGQIYNKKYWKLPLVYGGFFALGYAVNFYAKGYTKYKDLLFRNLEQGYTADGDIYVIDGTAKPPITDVYTTANYRRIVDLYKRQRDFFLIMMGGMYLLQMVDAHVDAHLKEFDLNPNLHVSLYPTMERSAMFGNQQGVSLVIRF
ncbi:MAG: DUF5683 domain-containing protein [Chryseolinea sp.]